MTCDISKQTHLVFRNLLINSQFKCRAGFLVTIAIKFSSIRFKSVRRYFLNNEYIQILSANLQ